jgi:hypothetical protein
MNMGKVLFIWDYFSPTFIVPNEMKKYVLECKQDEESMVFFGGGEFPSWIFTCFHRSRSRKVGFYLLDYTFVKTLAKFNGFIPPTHPALTISKSPMFLFGTLFNVTFNE